MKNELKALWKTFIHQVLGQPEPPQPRYSTEPLFTKNALYKMSYYNLSEKQVLDVLYKGSLVQEDMLIRKYNGYEIGLIYGRDRSTGRHIIFSAWKRGRR